VPKTPASSKIPCNHASTGNSTGGWPPSSGVSIPRQCGKFEEDHMASAILMMLHKASEQTAIMMMEERKLRKEAHQY
ncbi:hypothetical protein VP01_8759g1, partial [Puccinia sorghi]